MTRFYILIPLVLLIQACETIQQKENPQPDNMLLTYKQAMQAYQAGDLENAESGLKLITEHVPKDASAWFRLGNVYARTERPDAAIFSLTAFTS